MTGTSRLRVGEWVAVPVLAAALGWAPAAHAAGVSVSLPSVPVSTAPANSTAVTRTAENVIRAAAAPTAPVKAAAAAAVTETVARTVRTASATTQRLVHSVPAARTAAAHRAAPERTGRQSSRPASSHVSARTAARPSRHGSTSRSASGTAPLPAAPLGARRQASTHSVARSGGRLPAAPPPSPLSADGAAGTGASFAPLFFALGTALLALRAKATGRRVFPAVANGCGCALTLDLERPD